jgi:hypothetical protein
MSNPSGKRVYHSFDPNAGYPAGGNLYYECVTCGVVLPSSPSDSTLCSCGNIAIDVDYGRISIKDHAAARLFSLEDSGGR